MIQRMTSASLAAKLQTNKLLKIVALDQCQHIAKCGMNLSIQLQPTEGFEQFNMVVTYEQTEKRLSFFHPKEL